MLDSSCISLDAANPSLIWLSTAFTPCTCSTTSSKVECGTKVLGRNRQPTQHCCTLLYSCYVGYQDQRRTSRSYSAKSNSTLEVGARVVVNVDDKFVGTSMLHEKPHRNSSLQLARQSLVLQMAPLRPMSDVVALKRHWESGPCHPVLKSARVGQYLLLRIIWSNLSGPQYLQTTGAMSISKVRSLD
jgi:hypothetical protein